LYLPNVTSAGSTSRPIKSAEDSFQFCAARLFSVSFFGLYSSKLALKPMDCQVDAAVSIRAFFRNYENLAMLGPGDYFHLNIAFSTAIDDHINLGDIVIVAGQLGSLLFGVFFDGIRYVDMFASDCKKHHDSP